MPKADDSPRYPPFPPYSYVPGLWPHPHSHPLGHRFGPPFPPGQLDDLANDPTFRLGVDLFSAGYYWEAHEAWEHLWHAAGRSGSVADFLKALIQLAVAGVKVREGREEGVRTHARRAAELLAPLSPRGCGGLDPVALRTRAIEVADSPPAQPTAPRRPVEIVFDWTLNARAV